jgi:hypothetical protein
VVIELAAGEVAERPKGGDHWLTWVITLSAIGLPILVLLVVDSIPNASVTWNEVAVSARRGDFLIAVLILCLEAIRRWWRDVDCDRWFLRAARLTATVLCTVAAVVLLTATATAASVAVTAKSGDAIEVITVACFYTAFMFGSLAVGVRRMQAGA